MASKEINIIIPAAVWEKLQKLSRKVGITIEDIVMRGILLAVEELEGE
ncbi:MAG: hypothetical protein NDF55_10725 [archaeon GB-1867-005]|nr:hypothetical protein [Candidatus Culexmicrobium cathedralense]